MHIGDFVHRTVDGVLRRSFAAPAAAPKGCPLCSAPTKAFAVFGDTPLLRACTSCELEFLDPIPTPEELAAYYSDYPTTKCSEEDLAVRVRWARQGIEAAFSRLGSLAPALKGGRWLDVAFGAGESMFAAAELGAKVSGIDIDPSAVARARDSAEARGHDIDIQATDVAGVVSQGRAFDVVKAAHVIEHTRDPRSFLRAIRQVLRPGGILMLECPNNRAFLWLVKNATRGMLDRLTFYNALKTGEHLWGFTSPALRKLLEDEGFSVVEFVDYSAADPEYQPSVALWYPRWRVALREFVRQPRGSLLFYAAARSFDLFSSRLARAGSGFAVVARAV